MMNKSELVAKYGELMTWWGTADAETDCERDRRQISRSRQYMARYASYAYPWGSKSDNIVEITIFTARHNEVAKASVHKKVFDSRPRKTAQDEVEWACEKCGIVL